MSYKKYIGEIKYLLGVNSKKVPLLIALFISSSLLDVIGIGLVAPYVSLLLDSSAPLNESIISIYRYVGVSDLTTRSIVIYTGWLLLIVFVAKSVLSILINNKILKFCFNQGFVLRSHLMKTYQDLPFEYHIERNSSENIRNIDLAAAFSHGTLQAILRLLSEGIVVFVIVMFLMYQNPYVMGFLIILLLLVFFIYDMFFKKIIIKYGSISNKMHKKIVKNVYEGIEGLKEIRILGKEKYFLNNVENAAFEFASKGSKSSLISSSPRYLVESVLVFFIVMLVFSYTYFELGTDSLLPTISMFGVASIRLAPSANQIISGVSKIRFSRSTVSILFNDLKEVKKYNRLTHNPIKESIDFNSLTLFNVDYSFPGSKTRILRNLSLNIKKGESVAFIGGSGAGKTTLINVITGLLEPVNGKVLVNGTKLNTSTWMPNIAYLPQQVFIIDDSILKNVALGECESEINIDQVIDSLDKAKLLDLLKDLPDGVNTIIGEKGVRLSGGQRQRLALARAFYHRREVLIMDESTSALDEKVEKEIIEEIKQLKGKKTIIIIAHRLSTVEHCDHIYELDNGRLVKHVNYNHVVNKNS